VFDASYLTAIDALWFQHIDVAGKGYANVDGLLKMAVVDVAVSTGAAAREAVLERLGELLADISGATGGRKRSAVNEGPVVTLASFRNYVTSLSLPAQDFAVYGEALRKLSDLGMPDFGENWLAALTTSLPPGGLLPPLLGYVRERASEASAKRGGGGANAKKVVRAGRSQGAAATRVPGRAKRAQGLLLPAFLGERSER
jgi:hypothetical protein